MGTWGTGPFDTDDAGDMVAGLMAPIEKAVEGDAYHYSAARCAVQFVLAAHGTDILGGPSVEPCFRALVKMRLDSEWLASWNQPKRIAKALNAEIVDVLDKMQRCRGCVRKHGKAWLRELYTIGTQVISSPVPKPERRKLPRRVSRAKVRRK